MGTAGVDAADAARCGCRWNEFHERLREFGRIRVATIGPSGTSSELAAEFLVREYCAGGDTEVLLCDSFEDAAESVHKGSAELLLVPHAYASINLFYTDRGLAPLHVFFHETPVYGLARRREDRRFPDSPVSVASHPAVESLVRPLLKEVFEDRQEPELRVLTAKSNSLAAEMLAAGDADFAVTNRSSADRHDLEFLAVHGTIDLSWTIFARRG